MQVLSCHSPIRPPSPSPHNNNSLFIRSIWFTEQTLSLGEQTHLELGYIARCTIKTTLQPTTYHWTPGTRHPCRPTDPCSSLDRILSDYLICIYILLRCSRSRHHIYESFAHFTQLLLRYYVQPDDGHHKGRNM